MRSDRRGGGHQFMFSTGHFRDFNTWFMLADCSWTDRARTWEFIYLPCLPPELSVASQVYCLLGIYNQFTATCFSSSCKRTNFQIELYFPKWISTRSSLPSEGSANTRKFCTYGFVYPRSYSPSTWWWASLLEPPRRTAAETPRVQQPGICPLPRVYSTWI